ncbi:MAG: DUF5676 family membrane protein [bacterium]|nr:DUF5676 family membrane protein [bacterium]
MLLNKKKFASQITLLISSAYLVCALFTAIWPIAATKLVGWMMHILNVEQFAYIGITFGGTIIGLIQVVIYSYIFSWLFATVFNRSLK